MIKILKYRPDEKPGYRIERFKCGKFNGIIFFCEECSKRHKYRLVKLRKPKEGKP